MEKCFIRGRIEFELCELFSLNAELLFHPCFHRRLFTQRIRVVGGRKGFNASMKMPLFLPTPAPKSIETFRTLYQTRFGRSLSAQDAREMASRYLLIYYLGTSVDGKAVDKDI